MASNTNVELYLEKHRISSVLQDLMHKIVRETPPDPIKFMIRNLQRLDEKSKSSHDSTQGWGNTQPVHAGSGPSQHKKSRGFAIDKSSDFRRSTTTSSQDWQALGSTDGNAVGSRSRDYSKPWLSGSRPGQKVNVSDSGKFRRGYSDEDQQNFESQQSYKSLEKGKKEDPLNAFFSQDPTASSIGMKKNKAVERSQTWNTKDVPAVFMDSIQSISNRKLPQGDYLLSDELKHQGKYYDENLTMSTNNASINKQRSARYQQVKLLKNNHKKQLQELVSRQEDSKENHWRHQQNFVNNDEYDESNELLEDSAALAEEGVTRVKNRHLRVPVATRKAINRQGGVNVHSIIQSQFNKIMDQNETKGSLEVGQEDKDDDVATARSQISEPDSLSHIVSQPLWKANQDEDALSTVSGSRAVESSVFSQGRYGYRSAEDFAHSSNTARTNYNPEQVSSTREENNPGTSRSTTDTINQPDSARTFTFDDNSRHVWRKTQSEVDDTDVSEAGWAPTSNDHFSSDKEDHIVDQGNSSIGFRYGPRQD